MRFANTAWPETTVVSQPKVDPSVKILDNAKDRDVACQVLYADATYLYVDAAKEIKATAEEVFDAFVKRCLIDVSGVKYVPISCKNTPKAGTTKEYNTLTYVKADTSTATTAVLATVRSTN